MVVKNILRSLISKCGALRATFDIRVFFFFGGLALMGYGLYLLAPWISFTVVGTILFLFGWLMGGER